MQLAPDLFAWRSDISIPGRGKEKGENVNPRVRALKYPAQQISSSDFNFIVHAKLNICLSQPVKICQTHRSFHALRFPPIATPQSLTWFRLTNKTQKRLPTEPQHRTREDRRGREKRKQQNRRIFYETSTSGKTVFRQKCSSAKYN